MTHNMTLYITVRKSDLISKQAMARFYSLSLLSSSVLLSFKMGFDYSDAFLCLKTAIVPIASKDNAQLYFNMTNKKNRHCEKLQLF